VVNNLHKDLPRASTSKHASTGGAKEWDKVSSKGETIWKTPVVNWTWDQFKEGAMKALGQPRDHLDTHLASLDQAGMLKWKCIVVMHRLYGSTKNSFVASNNEFQPFLKVGVDNPASKVIIRISMDDPNAQAAKKVQVSDIAASSISIGCHVADVLHSIDRKGLRMKPWPSATPLRRNGRRWPCPRHD
jgi:hypothetical protein